MVFYNVWIITGVFNAVFCGNLLILKLETRRNFVQFCSHFRQGSLGCLCCVSRWLVGPLWTGMPSHEESFSSERQNPYTWTRHNERRKKTKIHKCDKEYRNAGVLIRAYCTQRVVSWTLQGYKMCTQNVIKWSLYQNCETLLFCFWI